MNALFFVKGSTGLIVFLAAVFALLTQLQVRNIIPVTFRVKNPVLLEWHRWAGRIALGGFVLNRMICQLVGVYPTFPFEARHFAHGVLSALCAAAILSKIWVTRGKVKWEKKRILTWVVTVFIVGASFSTLTGALAAWRWANPTVTWGKNEWLIYQAATLGHVGLAIALIWLGRLALVNGRGRDQVDTLVERSVRGWHRIAKNHGN
jgi:hypothetical protein